MCSMTTDRPTPVVAGNPAVADVFSVGTGATDRQVDGLAALREGIAQLRLRGHRPPARYWIHTGEVEPVDTCDVYRALLWWFLGRPDCTTSPDAVHDAFWSTWVQQSWPGGRDTVCSCRP